jgi:superfamily II RNA helicase
MVKVCPILYTDDEKYQDHFDMFSFPLSSFQKYAIEAVVEGHHTLVTAHTGSGKTLPAEFAIQYFTQKGKKVIYTSPIKALSNQKYYEFSKKYPNIKFGLFTGDIKTNPEADVLIMTTEILMNYLFIQKDDVNQNKGSLNFQIDLQNELGCVVFDEVHYINDQERGQVWEKTILMLPEHIQMVMLSATIDNPEGFAKWIEDRYMHNNNGIIDGFPIAKRVYLASTNNRVVPLSHYGFITTTEAIFKTIKDKDVQKQIRDNTNTLIDLQEANGNFKDIGYNNIKKYTKMFEDNQIRINRKHTLNQLSLFLRDREMLPAISFVFSRKNVESMAKEITVPLLEDDSKVPYIVRKECEQILRKLPNFEEYLQLPEYLSLVALLEKGVGIHHSGMIPVLREIVELMISKRYIKLLFATESFAIGLDCPIKTAIFTSLTKFDGNNDRYLLAHEYTQMAGRAGRRGIDTVGYVVHCNNLFEVPTLNEYKTILGGVPQTLISKFHISYGLLLNLLKNGTTSLDDMYSFCEKSMVKGEITKASVGFNKKIAELEDAIKKKKEMQTFIRTPLDICKEYIDQEKKLKTSVNKKRKECERIMETLRDQYKTILQDLGYVRQLDELEQMLESEHKSLEYNQSWIRTNVDSVYSLMKSDNFIDDNGLTSELGKIASNLAEVHPLIMANVMIQSDYFHYFDSKQIVGLLSCFTDIKISSELKSIIPLYEDNTIKSTIHKMIKMCNQYEKREREFGISTGIHYDTLLMFDMIQYSMDWCDCQTEKECKYFIQSVIVDKGISVGDFTKAMMKIVTITKELENVCETFSQIDLLYKLRQIDGMILKYVLTSQSLYV